MSTHRLPRRTLLRGILAGVPVAVGLPALEAMLNGTGTALADGTPIPKKFGMWFFGNGVDRSQWNPTTTGMGWELTPALAPLATVKPYVSVVTNTWIPGHYETAHWSQASGVRRASDSGGPTIDDTILDHLQPGAIKRSVDVRITRVPNAAYVTDDDGTNPGFSADPQAVYQSLFTGYSPDTPPPPKGLFDARRRVIDAVLDDAKRLRARVGASDQKRLDAHIQSVHDLEASVLEQPELSCSVPADPGPRPPDSPGLHEPLEEVNQAMSDMIAYALACDITRGFRVYFTGVQSFTVFWQAGADRPHHDIGHDSPTPAGLIGDIATFTMKQLGYLLDRMQKTSVGDGNLLDHSCIWVTSEIDQPQDHDTYSIPTLVVGKAGGSLRGGYHYDAKGIPNGNMKADVPDAIHARALVTMMRALDMQVEGFGSGVARATSSISELES